MIDDDLVGYHCKNIHIFILVAPDARMLTVTVLAITETDFWRCFDLTQENQDI
jgi:hypothetical protein